MQSFVQRPFDLKDYKNEVEEYKTLSLDELLDKFPTEPIDYSDIEKRIEQKNEMKQKNSRILSKVNVSKTTSKKKKKKYYYIFPYNQKFILKKKYELIG